MSTHKTKSSITQLQKKSDNANSTAKKNDEDHSRETGVKHLVSPGPARSASTASSISCAASAPFCRICRDDDAGEPLISPCNCKGSLNYCHASCLRHWLTEKVHNLKEPSCEICKSAYEVRYERVGPRDCGPCRQFHGRREFIHFVVMSFCLFVLGSSIAYTSWGGLSSSELAINFRLSPLAELTYSVYFIIDVLCLLVIVVEFHVGIWPVIKKWWSSNLSVVVIDKNNVAICAETLRVVEEASSLLEEEIEEEIEEEETEDENEEAETMEAREEEATTQRFGGGDTVARVTYWWVKLLTRTGPANGRESDLEALEKGRAPPLDEVVAHAIKRGNEMGGEKDAHATVDVEAEVTRTDATIGNEAVRSDP